MKNCSENIMDNYAAAKMKEEKKVYEPYGGNTTS